MISAWGYRSRGADVSLTRDYEFKTLYVLDVGIGCLCAEYYQFLESPDLWNLMACFVHIVASFAIMIVIAAGRRRCVNHAK